MLCRQLADLSSLLVQRLVGLHRLSRELGTTSVFLGKSFFCSNLSSTASDQLLCSDFAGQVSDEPSCSRASCHPPRSTQPLSPTSLRWRSFISPPGLQTLPVILPRPSVTRSCVTQMDIGLNEYSQDTWGLLHTIPFGVPSKVSLPLTAPLHQVSAREDALEIGLRVEGWGQRWEAEMPPDHILKTVPPSGSST